MEVHRFLETDLPCPAELLEGLCGVPWEPDVELAPLVLEDGDLVPVDAEATPDLHDGHQALGPDVPPQGALA